jgi:hypothetical protein
VPNSGEVLGIHVAGRYLAPGAAVEALKPITKFADSDLLDVLARARTRRNAG